ncbi:MAG: hypothetical protein C4321_07205 [Chloroflexota bacterium]
MLCHKLYEAYYQQWLEYPDELFMATPAGWISTYTHLGPGGGRTVLDDWQVFILDNPHRYAIYAKTRQAGFSWAESLRKLARAALEPGYRGVFVSINLEESKNKIRYARMAYESLPRRVQARFRLTKDTVTELGFSNGSRIISLPAKPVRGYDRADVTLDEAAHIQRFRSIYEGSTAASVRSPEAGVTVGSSPMGRDGLYYEIWADPEGIYRIYDGNRYAVYWWDVTGLCVDVHAARRAAEAEDWESRRDRDSVWDRVERFGTERLREEFLSKRLEAFLQEFEADFADASLALIPTWAIEQCSDPEWQGGYYAMYENPSGAQLEREIIPGLSAAIANADSKIGIYAGYDIARKRHQSVLTLLAPQRLGGRWRLVLIGFLRFRNAAFPVQEALLRWLLHQPIVRQLSLDATGMGMQMGESLRNSFGSRAIPVEFTAPTKERLATYLALCYERGLLYHRADRDLKSQIYAVKKVATPSGNLVYRATEADDHHADAFWALALAALDAPAEANAGEISLLLAPPRGV